MIAEKVKLMEIKRKARIDSKTLEDLEFPAVLRQVAEFCVTEPGREKVLAIIPFQDFDEI